MYHISVDYDFCFILIYIESVSGSCIVIVSVIISVVEDNSSVLHTCGQSGQVDQCFTVFNSSCKFFGSDNHFDSTVCIVCNSNFSNSLVRIGCIVDSYSDFRNNSGYNKCCIHFLISIFCAVVEYQCCVLVSCKEFSDFNRIDYVTSVCFTVNGNVYFSVEVIWNCYDEACVLLNSNVLGNDSYIKVGFCNVEVSVVIVHGELIISFICYVDSVIVSDRPVFQCKYSFSIFDFSRSLVIVYVDCYKSSLVERNLYHHGYIISVNCVVYTHVYE